jgi:bla regulator protein BlaR1
MINYLVNFTLCSALLLAAYHLLLKNKTTYTFNRIYLLLAVVFSLVVPFVVITRETVPNEAARPLQELTQIQANYSSPGQMPGTLAATVHATSHKPTVNYMPYVIIGLYIIVSLLLLYRFAKNLNAIRRSVLNNECVSYETARLILVNEKLTPHTFLNFIFINKDEYLKNQIEPDVINTSLPMSGSAIRLILYLSSWFRLFAGLTRLFCCIASPYS